MTEPQCMGCGKPRDIPASTAVTPCSECGSTGIITYWPLTPIGGVVAPVMAPMTLATYRNNRVAS